MASPGTVQAGQIEATWRVRLARLDTGLGTIAALALALYLAFLIVPVLLSLKTSFTNQNILFPDSSFVGLANYRPMLHDTALARASSSRWTWRSPSRWWPTWPGCASRSCSTAPASAIGSCARMAFLPQVISGIIAGFVWSWMLSPHRPGEPPAHGHRPGPASRSTGWGRLTLAQLSAAAVVSWV